MWNARGVGLIAALWQLRRPGVAELLGGLVVGYLGSTMLAVHDPRYTLPLVVYGCTDPKAGACHTLYQITDDPRLNHRCRVVAGVRASGA